MGFFLSPIFAKNLYIAYNQLMKDKIVIPAIVASTGEIPAIIDEEQFQDAIIAAKEKS